ncbi:M48 family metallopeptidase [Denitromonas iodatirespirans]|uniref:M48 family metallopeptidase n=1 Tax=Denitromonas iodatirespirans TaxID=2795389 RepID=A0A944H6D5_DENI1|nr:M48 family metallopeptidase [Denitromonas iodatirespirans]MBT0960053.1 M48 family metallopeptidase [Denitromonas iodatirespirans]
MAQIDARLFDGQSSRPHAVRLCAVAGGIDLLFEDGSGRRERLAPAALTWHEPLGHATRRVDLPGGRHCELACGPALSDFLRALNHRERSITHWQGSGLRVLVAIVLILAVGAAGYRWGLPLLARGVAHALPTAAVQTLDAQLLKTLDDGGLLEPTALAPARIAALNAEVAPLLAARRSTDPVRLHFRQAPAFGANAFALPGGDIVVTDALVALAPSDAHVAAVVAHELGHVAHRHGLRNLIQASVLAAVIGVWTGDVSSLATVGATMVASAAYSRDFEREADAWGADLLHRSGRSPALLADMLERLEQAHRPGGRGGGLSDYLSSHPATAERIERLNRPTQ